MKNPMYFLKMFSLLLLVSGMGTLNEAFAQGKGLIFDDAAYMASPRLPEFGGGSKFNEMPPKVDLRPYAPYPGYQGEVGSCVGWALGYAAQSILYAQAQNMTDRDAITRNAFSALFIYNQIRERECSFGSNFEKALQLLKNTGNVLKSDFDHTTCEILPDEGLRRKASNYRISEYMSMFTLSATAKEKEIIVKRHLAATKSPVVVGLDLRKNFTQIRPGQEYWDPYSGDTSPDHGHAMTVVGYDESRKAFLLMNSWGKSWGKDGFIWIKFDAFGEFCKYAYSIKMDPPKNVVQDPKVMLAGDFRFRFPDENGTESVKVGFDDMRFSPAPVVLRGRQYETTKATWPIGSLFQLVATTIQKDQHVYVFSIDPTQIANVHWPRRSGLDPTQFFGANNTSLIPYAGAEMVIPAQDGALELAHRGADHIVVLYSARRIDDAEFKDIIERVRSGSGDFFTRLQSTLGSKMVPPTQITYHPSRMSVKAEATQGYIVPIILKVNAQ